MKIQTSDCVNAILKYYYELDLPDNSLVQRKNWKRLSKSGSGDSIIRIFENKVNGAIVHVFSSETKILNIVPGAPKITNIKSFLKEKLNDVDFWELQYETMGEDIVVNWPQVTLPPYDGDDGEIDVEPLDMENFEWISITDDTLVITCGGDWQQPLILTIKLINGKLTVTETREGYPDGLDEEMFKKILG